MIRKFARKWTAAAVCAVLVAGVGSRSLASGEDVWDVAPGWSYAAEAWAYRVAAEQEPEAPVKPGEVSIASASSPAESAPQVQLVQYQINAGDTLYRIAKQFGLSVDDLLAANPTVTPTRLRIGQLLDIPQVVPDLSVDGEAPVIKRVLNSTLTAYTAGVESTGKTKSHPAYGITRSGSKAEEGRTIAVDPSIIPLGATVLIEGIGIRKAEDTGSAIKGARIDVFMEDVEEAIKFGVKKNVKVYVLADNAA